MARDSSLKSVYSAIFHLKREGAELSVNSVAKASGVGRSTMYQDDEDWNVVMSVIAGGEIPPSILVEMGAEVQGGKTSRIKLLSDRVGLLENEIEEAIRLADDTYRGLVDQLQYYFAISYETPTRQKDVIKTRNELTVAYDEINRLKLEIERLVDAGKQSSVVSAKGRKRHISIPAELSVAKAAAHFLDELHRHIPNKDVGKAFTSISFVGGLPLSGKSAWIDRQIAPGPGTALFIEGSLHTEEFRSLLLGNVRRLSQAEVRCVWLLTSKDVCLRRVAMFKQMDGAARELIHSISSETELVSITEAFDSFVGVR